METSDLSPVEQRLVHAAEHGELLDLAPDVPDAQVTPERMRPWGNDQAIRSEVLRDVLQGRHVAHLDPRGVRVRGAVIDGYIDLDRLDCNVPLELSSSRLRHGFTAQAARFPNLSMDRSWVQDDGELGVALDLLDAEISGKLSMSGAFLASRTGIALQADGLSVGEGLYLDRRFRAEGAGKRGAVRLHHAHVDGSLSMTGATLICVDGPALVAGRLRVSGGLNLRNGFCARGSGEQGVISLRAATIDGQFSMSGATVTSPDGSALSADRLTVSGGMFFNKGFTAEGAGEKGVVRLIGASINGAANFSGAKLTSRDGSALHADRLKVTGPLLLNEEFTAEGVGERGAVRLLGASIDGQVSMRGARLACAGGPALFADRLKVAASLYLDEGFTATGGGEDGVVRLPAASIGERIRLDDAQVTTACKGHLWLVDALAFTLTPKIEAASWLKLLRDGTVDYAAQPYRLFAALAAAQGHDQDARRALMAQQRDRLARGKLGAVERGWTRFTGGALGFGYQPWRALLLLLATLLVSLGFVFYFGDKGLEKIDDTGTAGMACSTVEKIGYSLDLSIPLITVDASDSCAPSPSTSGTTITVIGWLLQLAGWASASLFVAGFTSIIRKA